ncbi:MAG: hypothetical protein K2O46_05280, partial [Bacteroidales bacterium]|nr:hypothetical protein [Bacteroidales bacterium]
IYYIYIPCKFPANFFSKSFQQIEQNGVEGGFQGIFGAAVARTASVILKKRGTNGATRQSRFRFFCWSERPTRREAAKTRAPQLFSYKFEVERTLINDQNYVQLQNAKPTAVRTAAAGFTSTDGKPH